MVAGLIGIIAGIVFIACFAGFNLGNSCDVNLLFHTFEKVPVFFTVLLSFAVGMICALPFAFIHRIKRAAKIKAETTVPAEKKEKKPLFAKKQAEPSSAPEEASETPAPETGSN